MASKVVPLASPRDEAEIRAAISSTSRAAVYKALGAGKPYEQAMSSGLVQVSGAASREVLNGGRDTITEAVQRDPKAQGWARVTGGDPCAFCAMLSGRGPVYKEESASFEAHDHCSCDAEPVYEGSEWPGRGREFQQRWYESDRTLNGFRQDLNKTPGSAYASPNVGMPGGAAAEMPGAPAWTPTMDEDQARDWLSGSAFDPGGGPLPGFYHGTSADVAAEIKASGFSVSEAGGSSRFGKGVYLATDRESAAYWAKTRAAGGEVLQTAPRVENVRRISYEAFARETDAYIEAIDRAGLLRTPGMKFDALMGRLGELRARWATEQGYDSVLIKAPLRNPGESLGDWLARTGGDQLIVYDAKKVVVVKAARP